MIRIDKSGVPIPEKLIKEGQEQTIEDQNFFDTHPDYKYSRSNNFTFDKNIYGDSNVKKILREIHHHKCCYCESKVKPYNREAEHFRPKAFSQQDENSSREYPGYYWLAYDWENLYLACAACNRGYKKNFFPLLNPQDRAQNHHMDLAQEKPMLIDPGKENPEEFIAFRGETPYGLDEEGRGEATIKYIGLDREDLCEARLEKLDHVKSLLTVIRSAAKYPEDEDLQIDAEEAQESIAKLLSPDGEFLAALNCAIANNFYYVS